MFSKWEQVCDYIEFTDKVRIKECADKGMVLKARALP
jgi:hypothetical protein